MGKFLLASDSSPRERDPWESIRVCEIVEAIGLETFPDRLLAGLSASFAAEHCTFFRMKDQELEQVGSASLPGAQMPPKSELSLYEIKRQLSQLRASGPQLDIQNVSSNSDVCAPASRIQRVYITAKRDDAVYCLRFLRLCGADLLLEDAIERLRAMADLVIALVVRHSRLFAGKPNLTPALSKLEEIEDCVLSATDLSRREGEVCSRILYGMSSCGIALDLGIGKESVMTYRKRAYLRLGIGSQRELLMWYLALWTTLRGRHAGAARPSIARKMLSKWSECAAPNLLATA